jgi:hypothetical protein
MALGDTATEPTPRALAQRLAARQRGLVHLDQAVALGLSKHAVYRLARRGEWVLVLPKVFSVVEQQPVEWRRRVLAACLWAGGEARASHRSAGPLWQLDGVPGGHVEITMKGVRESPEAGIIVRSALVVPAMQRLEGIPVTSATKTLVDLASVLTEPDLELAVEDALRRRLTSLPRLRIAIEESAGRRGIAALRRIADDHREGQPPTDSGLEAKVLRILKHAALPPPCNQLVVEDAGGKKARLDFAYPDARVALEVDGFRWHSGRRAWRRDRGRLNRLVMAGWRVVHVTQEDVEQGGLHFVAALRSFLGQQRLT